MGKIPRTRTTFVHARAVKLSKAKVHVYSGSVLCLGKKHEHPQSIEHWKGKVECLTKKRENRELDYFDGEAVEFEWKHCPGHTTLQFLREVQRTMEEKMMQPEKFEDRVIFMSMYNDIDWGKAEHKQTCILNSVEVEAYAKRFPEGHWSFDGPGTEEQRYGTHAYKPNGLWDRSADVIMLHLRTSALDRGSLKSKGGGKLSIHYNGDSSTAELLFRVIVSVDELSVHGAVSGWCEELAQQISDQSSSSTGIPVAEMTDESESRISPNVVSILANPLSINFPVQGGLLRRHNKRFAKLPEDIRVSKATEDDDSMRKISRGQYQSMTWI